MFSIHHTGGAPLDPSLTVGGTDAMLSPEIVKELSHDFDTFTKEVSYNTLALLLEFSAWARTAGFPNLKEAFDRFLPQPAAIVEKYRGGSSDLIAMAYAERLRFKGYQPNLMGESRPNAAPFRFPSPSKNTFELPLNWEQAKDHLHDVSLFFLTLKGTDAHHAPLVLAFKKYLVVPEIPQRSTSRPTLSLIFDEKKRYGDAGKTINLI